MSERHNGPENMGLRFTSVPAVAPVEILQYVGFDYEVQPVPGQRYRYDWLAFSVLPGSDVLHDPEILQEPTLDDLGLADAYHTVPGAASLTPSQLLQEAGLSPTQRFGAPLAYIRRLWDFGLLKTFDAEPYEDPVFLNKVPLGDQQYRIFPEPVLGTFAHGEASPRFTVYNENATMDEIVSGQSLASLAFYGSPVSIEPAVVAAAFPLLQPHLAEVAGVGTLPL